MICMFFRRERPKVLTLPERLETLKQAGFVVDATREGFRVSRNGCAVVIQDADGQPRLVQRAGIAIGEEIGSLVDGGFQKFFQTPSGRRKPALASELKSIHDFEEDLKEILDLKSLYNESLGTVSTFYLYDRVEGRDRGVRKRIWEQ
jgi:hypothetical protein